MATTVRIPIDLHTIQDSNAFWTVSSLTAYKHGHWEFLLDVEGKLYGIVDIPQNVDSTPAAKIELYIGANATSGVTRLQASYKAIANGESYNFSSFTDETIQDITVPSTARELELVTFPTSGSLSDTISAGDQMFIQIFHDGDHANDTLAVNTELISAYLKIDLT